jgi:hypothetical protein
MSRIFPTGVGVVSSGVFDDFSGEGFVVSCTEAVSRQVSSL